MDRLDMPDDRVTQFHPGQVWESNKGVLWKCKAIENGQAVFRLGFDGSGRIKRRAWDGVKNFVLYYDPVYDGSVPEEQQARITQ